MPVLSKISCLKFFIILITITFSISPVKAGWLKKAKQVESLEEIEQLKKHCHNMLARKNQGPQQKVRWDNRLKQLEKLSLKHNTPTAIEVIKVSKITFCQPDGKLNYWLAKVNQAESFQEFGKLEEFCLKMLVNGVIKENERPKFRKRWFTRLRQLEEFQEIKKLNGYTNKQWLRDINEFSVAELKLCRDQCINMLGYKNFLLTNSVWLRRLREIDNLLNLLSRNKRVLTYPQYKIRTIFINTKNPHILDLHGVASAQIAFKKVMQFINAAKSKQKNKLLLQGKATIALIKNVKVSCLRLFLSGLKSIKMLEAIKWVKVREVILSLLLSLLGPKSFTHMVNVELIKSSI